jgi:hypothetical protein
MMQEAPIITINGMRLNEAEADVVRIALDTFAAVMAEGIEAKDEGITAALTERYRTAMSVIQKLLETHAERLQ